MSLGVGVLAARADGLAALGVAKIGEIGIVELQVAAAGGMEVGDLLAVDPDEIGVEALDLRIDALRHGGAAAAQAHRR